MKVLVVGYGSMGRRRIRLYKQLDSKAQIICVDSNPERIKQIEEAGYIAYNNLKDAIKENPTIAFVSTSPLSHADIIPFLLEHNINTFTEINLSSQNYDQMIQLSKKKGLVLFLSSTPMYRKEIEYIKESVKATNSKKSYIYHVGQYLPDWHPWENYKNFFVGDKKTNGCREIMAIEFPWIFDVFGVPEKWKVYKEKNSTLDIDYPDLFQILFKHSNGNSGIIQIDVISRKAVRNFECIAEDLYISWDGTPEGLNKFDYFKKENIPIQLYTKVDKQSEYSASIIEDAYLSEIKSFLNTG